jgi:outer membrane receptor protein involved in Fe transport
MPFPGYLSYLWGYIQAGGEGLIGNPDLKPEKTICYEIGLQGALTKTMNVTFNSYYKDISDLIGARFVIHPPLDPYLTYLNVEYGNVKGFEAIVDLSNRIISGKISYSLSWARGTSSYASHVLNYYIQNGLDTIFTIPNQEYSLDFDQRHRFFIQGIITLPQNFQANLFCFFGSGYPYTPPGLEGKTADYNISRMTFRRQIDLVLSRGFKKGRFTINANLELINLLDLRYQLKPVITMIPLDDVRIEDFKDYISLIQGLYHPAADFNHDGFISPREYYIATRKLLSENSNYIEAYSSPRRARIGLTINF